MVQRLGWAYDRLVQGTGSISWFICGTQGCHLLSRVRQTVSRKSALPSTVPSESIRERGVVYMVERRLDLIRWWFFNELHRARLWRSVDWVLPGILSGFSFGLTDRPRCPGVARPASRIEERDWFWGNSEPRNNQWYDWTNGFRVSKGSSIFGTFKFFDPGYFILFVVRGVYGWLGDEELW